MGVVAKLCDNNGVQSPRNRIDVVVPPPPGHHGLHKNGPKLALVLQNRHGFTTTQNSSTSQGSVNLQASQ